jgi:hypothetical protein
MYRINCAGEMLVFSAADFEDSDTNVARDLRRCRAAGWHRKAEENRQAQSILEANRSYLSHLQNVNNRGP